MFSRSRIYPLLLIIIVFAVWKFRQSKKESLVVFSGKTMGDIQYNIKYLDYQDRNFKSDVDSLLEVFNLSLNHYRPESEISLFNRDSVFYFKLPFFLPVLKKSAEIYKQTGGAFDPSIGQLINAWGFGPEEPLAPDSTTIDSLKELVYFDNIEFDNRSVRKKKAGIKLDFSAIAKGYAVDVVKDLLVAKGIENLFVEIGGELTCSGVNENGKVWRVGIIDPRSDILHQATFASLSINGKGVATSANNFNYIEKDGIRYVHTINPETGYPITHNLLSATILAPDCMTADALATAFMVMGVEKSIAFLENEDKIEGFLIYNDEKGIQTYVSARLKEEIELYNTH